MQPGMLWSWERGKSDGRPSAEPLEQELIWMGLLCRKVGTEGWLVATAKEQADRGGTRQIKEVSTF